MEKVKQCQFCEEFVSVAELSKTEMDNGIWLDICEECDLVLGVSEGK